jgi:hypothetical protein
VFDRNEMLTTREMNTFVTGRKAGTSGRTAVALACAAAMLLTACGGGGAGDTPVSTAVGTGTSSTAAVTTGSTTSSTSSAGASAGSTTGSTTTNANAVVAVPAVVSAAAPTSVAAPNNVASAIALMPQLSKSVREWGACDTADGTDALTRAVAAAKNAAFTLLVDCKVTIKIGTDIAKPIFIDDRTNIKFIGNGLFTVDNVFVPAFAIVNANNVTLLDWKVQYVGSMPADWSIGGFYRNGIFYPNSTGAIPSYEFNNGPLHTWLADKKGVTFVGSLQANWTGPIGASAVFHVRGTTRDLVVKGLKLFVASDAGGHQFVPVAISLNSGPKNNSNIADSASEEIPSRLFFDNIEFDGTIMGWQGSLRDSSFTNITSRRYGDLQDADGGNVGGVGKWFAPPHLFYLNFKTDADPRLANRNLTLKNVNDLGVRIGVARDKSIADSGSGYANSLKIGGTNILVDGYTSYRKDGFLDLLVSDGAVIQNVVSEYDSSFLNNVYPSIRFPQGLPYKNITLKNITVKDNAESSALLPIWSSRNVDNLNFNFQNVFVRMNKWAKSNYDDMGNLPRTYGHLGHQIEFQFDFKNLSTNMPVRLKSGTTIGVAWNMTASPSNAAWGVNPQVQWNAMNATSCAKTTGFLAPISVIKGMQEIPATQSAGVTFGTVCKNDAGLPFNASIKVDATAQ